MLQYFTYKGIVNVGCFPELNYGLLPLKYTQESIIVIGAGISGLAVARQLHNFGTKVTLLESSNKCGGRLAFTDVPCGDSGYRLSIGADILNGCINNPLSIVALQSGVDVSNYQMSDHCFIIDDAGTGLMVDDRVEERTEFHHNAILDLINRMKASVKQGDPNAVKLRAKSLEDLFLAIQNSLKDKTSDLTPEHFSLLQFYLGNTEYATSAPLNALSGFGWNDCEQFAQFAGPMLYLSGDSLINMIKSLSSNLDIHYQQRVTSIDSSSVSMPGGKVTVSTQSGVSYNCDRVVLALPVSVLGSGLVNIKPELSIRKTKALSTIGFGQMIKVSLLFKERFWDTVFIRCHQEVLSSGSKGRQIGEEGGVCFLGRVPQGPADRGFCHFFHDVDYKNKKVALLQTQVFGEALNIWCHKSDDELVQACVSTLKHMLRKYDICCTDMSSNTAVEDKFIVIWSHVARWTGAATSSVGNESCASQPKMWNCGSDDIGMSFTYQARNFTSNMLDDLAAESEDQRIFFVGEATTQFFPHCMTGAYLSGITEAARIAELSAILYDQRNATADIV